MPLRGHKDTREPARQPWLRRALPVFAALLCACEAQPPEATDELSFEQVALTQALTRQWQPPASRAQTACDLGELDSGGLSADDIDGDGQLDLVVSRIGQPPQLAFGAGGFTFSVIDLPGPSSSSATAILDLDDDGDLDLLFPAWDAGEHAFLRNEGGRNFVSVSAAESGLVAGDGFEGSCRGFRSVAAGDADGDGDLDLYLTRWAADTIRRQTGQFFENLGSGRFGDRTEAVGLAGAGAVQYNAHWIDLNGDGANDLLISGDFSTTRAYLREGGRYRIATSLGLGTRENGMGSALFDADGDGRLDWFVSGIVGDPVVCANGNPLCDGNRLYLADAQGGFTRAERRFGVADGGWGWAPIVGDFDLDGDEDLVQTNGYFPPFTAGIDPYLLDLHRGFIADPLRFWRNAGPATWREEGASVGLVLNDETRGGVAADFDADGDLDLVVAVNRDRPRLFENLLPAGGRSIAIALRQTYPNSAALGAVGLLRDPAGAVVQRSHIGLNNGYLGTGPAELRFALPEGGGRAYTVTIVWPDGREQGPLPATAGRQIIDRSTP